MLGKAQSDMKKYADKRRSDIEEYKVGDLVMLSTKDLKYLSQTSFGHISTKSSTIPTVSKPA